MEFILHCSRLLIDAEVGAGLVSKGPGLPSSFGAQLKSAFSHHLFLDVLGDYTTTKMINSGRQKCFVDVDIANVLE